MKNAKLIIDGKEIEALIDEKDLEKLTATNKTTGYERVRYGSTYYADSCGEIRPFVECTENSETVSEFDERIEEISLRMIKSVKLYLELLHDTDMMHFYGNLVF